MMAHRLLTGLLLISILSLPLTTAITPPAADAPNRATRVFISDDQDPMVGKIPPFVLSKIDDAIRMQSISMANVSRMRDYAYATTQPPYRVGQKQQTLSEYRLAQLRSIQQNDSTSLWLPDSQRSNGTIIKDAHVTILGVQEGTHSRLGQAGTNDRGNGSELLFIPRNGTVLIQLDYSTVVPNKTCTVSGRTKTCLNYTILDQRVNRTLEIGTQTWSDNTWTPRQLNYSNASATEPTTMQVRARIKTSVAKRTTTYVRRRGGWQLSNTTVNDTIALSHTVRDRTRVVVTTNQNLTVKQTIVRSEEGTDRIVLQFNGSKSLTDRRLWSEASFANNTGRVRNVWGIYSQRQYTNATRGSHMLTGTNKTSSTSGSNATLGSNNTTLATNTSLKQTLAQQPSLTTTRRQTVPFPSVLELQLVARSHQPTIQRSQHTSVLSAPELVETKSVRLSPSRAPLDHQVNLTSVPARGYTSIVITNVDQPITGVRDIHGDSVPFTTRTVRERPAHLSTTILNETHVRIQLTDATTNQPLTGQTLWLSGAAHGNVTTNTNGAVVVERRDLYVTVSFPGATNVSRSVFYGSAQTRIVFQPDPFNIYQLLRSLAGAVVSIAAFLIFFLPFAYLRR